MSGLTFRPSVRPHVILEPTSLFHMVDQCLTAASKARMPQFEIDEFRRLVFTAGSYAEAYDIICDFFEVRPMGWNSDHARRGGDSNR